MDISLEKEIAQVRVINSTRRYWFIRTYSGELYETFYDHNFIGLGFNHVPYQFIQDANLNDEVTLNRLQTYISNSTEYKKGEATKWAKQLISFDHEIKIDDIVIIPSKSSDYVAIGIVESNTYISKVKSTFEFDGKREPYPEKRKTVKWLKVMPKIEFRGDLRGMFASHRALSNADDYSEIIEGNLSTLYIKDEQIHLTIKIDQDEEINAFELQRFLEGLTYFYKELCLENGEDENEELYIKIKVQSKGGMFLKGISVIALVALTGAFILSDNPDVKLDLGILGKLEGKGAGLLQSWSNFLDKDQKRKIEWIKFSESREKLKAKPIKDSVTKEQDSISKHPQ